MRRQCGGVGSLERCIHKALAEGDILLATGLWRPKGRTTNVCSPAFRLLIRRLGVSSPTAIAHVGSSVKMRPATVWAFSNRCLSRVFAGQIKHTPNNHPNFHSYQSGRRPAMTNFFHHNFGRGLLCCSLLQCSFSYSGFQIHMAEGYSFSLR